jgi:hypothetical protein
MAETLNFNTVNRPVLSLVMMDDDRTEIKVSTPSEGLIEELQATLPELEPVLSTGDKAAISAIYDLAAKLISCNRSFLRVTGEDLRTKYRLDLAALIIFFNAYMDFISEVTNAKN